MAEHEYKNWRLDIDEENIVWLYFDRDGQAVNSFSREVLNELDCILEGFQTSNPKGVIITSAKKAGFIAGADITQFTTLETEEEAFDLIRQGQLVFDKLEKLPMPTIALINGFCLGGGYELALACRYRIALDDPKTKIGLPEIKLGIQPGWGGTVRLPALIGAPKAMSIILPGAAVSAKRAAKMGMVDAAVPERQLHRAARYYVLNKPKVQQADFWGKMANISFIRPLFAKVLYKQLAKKAKREHYPAPYAVVDKWVSHYGTSSAMVEEAKSIANLMMTDTAKNLLRVFFLQNTMKDLAKGVKYRAKHVHVIGAGTMGGDIAAWCALRGFQVTLQDQSPECVAPAIKRAHKLFKKKLKKPRLIEQAMDRMQADVSGLGVKGADVIIEAIFENLEVKQEVFKKVEQNAKADAILATNTSSIPLEEIATILQNPQRLIGIHFFNPVAKMPLVEIVRTTSTSNELVVRAAAFIKAIARSPLPVLSSPGFLVNRVLMPYLGEAMKLYEEGVDKILIDKVAKRFGMPMGPIALADSVGLDICLSVAKNLTSHFGGEVSPKLDEMVKQGLLGVKSGKGFYEYDKKGKKVGTSSSGSDSSKTDIPVEDRLILIMLNEAVACLSEGVVTDTDLLDAGMIFGTGFAPFRGGPINYAKTRGIGNVVETLEQLAKQFGPRFVPNPGWKMLMESNELDEEPTPVKIEEEV